jgi:ACR3 family arsenite transporter
MFSLARLFLLDQPAFRTGLILIGIAPCIAIVVMFALQGQAITANPAQVVRVALPLLLYFVVMWSTAFYCGIRSGLDDPRTAALAFTASGNNFELAIAVCISPWGVSSQQALAGVTGPQIEVPALVSLVYVSLWLRRRTLTNSEH